MTTGIYKLSFKNTDKVYIGKSYKIEKRLNNHQYNFRHNCSSKKLQEAYNIFGMPTLEILYECTLENLNTNELKYIDKYNSINNGFNTFNGSSGVPIGLYGEGSGKAKYWDEDYISVFNLLVVNQTTHQEIADITGISIYVVQSISSLSAHKWLEELFPEKYLILKELRGRRMLNNTYGSAESRGITYPAIRSPLRGII